MVDSAPTYACSGSTGEADTNMKERIQTAITSVSILIVVEQIYFSLFIEISFPRSCYFSVH